MAESENTQSKPPLGAESLRKLGSSLARWGAPPILPKPEECLRLAQSGIRMTQNLLTNPSTEALLRAELCMRQVADHLRQFPRSLARAASLKRLDRAALYRIAAEVKEELGQAHVLFQRVNQYYAQWISLYSVRRCGYTRTGSPARLTYQQAKPIQG